MSDKNPWPNKVHVTRITYIGTGATRAFASVAIGNTHNPSIVIHGVRIAQTVTGPRILLPVQDVDSFKYGVEVCDSRLREAIEAAVLAEWREQGTVTT